MAAHDANENMVECMELPDSMRDFYTEACKEDQYLASMSTPENQKFTTIMLQSRGRDVIARVENLSSVSWAFKSCTSMYLFIAADINRTMRIVKSVTFSSGE